MQGLGVVHAVPDLEATHHVSGVCCEVRVDPNRRCAGQRGGGLPHEWLGGFPLKTTAEDQQVGDGLSAGGTSMGPGRKPHRTQ